MTWSGAWMTQRLGVELTPRDVGVGRDPHALVGLALRKNPSRPHLLVSTVLGKHVPAPPAVVSGAGLDLAQAVRAQLDISRAGSGLAIGFAETATELGHRVAIGLGLPCLHSTRRAPLPGDRPLVFEEEHSHATTHYLNPTDSGLLETPGPIVLIDDELTTGRTAINTITALRTRSTTTHFVVAALLDMRSAHAIERMAAFATELDVRVDVVSLAAGRIQVPPAVGDFVPDLPDVATSQGARPVPQVRIIAPESWPEGVAQDASRGVSLDGARDLVAASQGIAQELAPELSTGRVHVLGYEELMHLPLEVAAALAEIGSDVTFSSTTRSPVHVIDEPGYAIRTGVSFASAEDGIRRFAYNVPRSHDIVVLLQRHVDLDRTCARGGLVDALGDLTPRVHIVVLP